MIPTPNQTALILPKIDVQKFNINGWNIIFTPKKSSLMSIRCLLQGGALSEQEGLAHLRDRALQQLMELNSELPMLSGEIEIITSHQYSHICYDGLCDELEDFLKTINHLCSNSPELNTVLNDCLEQISSELRSTNDWPQNILSAVFREHFTNLKWGIPGRHSTINQYTSDDLFKSWNHHYHNPSGTLIITGDLKTNDIQKLLKILPQSKPKACEAHLYRLRKEQYFIEMDLEQTHLLMATPIPGINTPHFDAWRVATEILSGDIDGKIPQKLRVNSGLTYDLSAFILEGTQNSVLMLTSSVSQFKQAFEIINTTLQQAHLDLSQTDINKALLHLKIEQIEARISCSDICDHIEQQWTLNQSIPPEFTDTDTHLAPNLVHQIMGQISSADWLCIAVGSKIHIPESFKTIDKPSSFD